MKKRAGGWTGIVGAVMVGVVIVAALLAPVLSPYDPGFQARADRLQPPFSKGHLLGTDNLGRDILSRLIWGSRVSILVGLVGSVLGALVGVTLGLLAGYYQGWVDTILMRLGDIQLAFPFVLLAIAVMGALGPGLDNVILVAIISGWIKYARVVRSNVLTVREAEYVQAAKALGLSNGRIIARHIFPNVIAPAIIVATLETGRIIVMEASLTFLGLGVPPSIPSWG
ncbi:MAG: ABC transporter permease, partial [Firmicutes bacterium]|nr:ABC transporter permease [Bacillota bacterium]